MFISQYILKQRTKPDRTSPTNAKIYIHQTEGNKMKKLSYTLNKEQGVFVIHSKSSYSCLGFEVCRIRASKLADELGAEQWHGSTKNVRHLKRLYRHYENLTEQARQKHLATGWRSKSELIQELIPYEGKRIEATNCLGEKVRFIVGKSTGFIPCHLEIKRRDSSGGCTVSGSPYTHIRII